MPCGSCQEFIAGEPWCRLPGVRQSSLNRHQTQDEGKTFEQGHPLQSEVARSSDFPQQQFAFDYILSMDLLSPTVTRGRTD